MKKILNEEEQLELVKNDPNQLKNINNPTYNVQLFCIDYNPFLLNYIQNPSEEIKLEAVKRNGLVIDCIKNPSEEIQLIALNRYKEILNEPRENPLLESIADKLEQISIMMFLEKLTNPKYVIMLYSLTKFQGSKEMIKKSPLWINNANLILEVMNEN